MSTVVKKKGTKSYPVRRAKLDTKSDVAEEQPDVYETSKRQSPAVRRRSHARQEQYRDRKSTEHTANEHRKIYEKLMFGYRVQEEAMASMQVASLPRTVIMPVSTRAVGFMSQFLFCKFARLQIKLPLGSTVYQLYRVTLMQVEIKLMQAMREQCSRNTGGRLFRSIDVTVEQVQIVSELGALFAPLANLVNSIGVTKTHNALWLPRLAATEYINGVRVPEPTTVTFSDLRQIVVLLSRRSTPVEYRRYFYDNNPLPGARWKIEPEKRPGPSGDVGLDDDTPILMNPDDFMPEEYSNGNLHEDVAAVQDLLEAVGRKYPKYVHVGRIDYKSNGHASLLISNDPRDIRCTDLRFTQDNRVVYANQRPLQGESIRFWSPRMLSDPEFYMGINHLVGELPNPALRTNAHFIRALEASEQESEVDFVATLENLLG